MHGCLPGSIADPAVTRQGCLKTCQRLGALVQLMQLVAEATLKARRFSCVTLVRYEVERNPVILCGLCMGVQFRGVIRG
jgi:hypothetical protein